MKKSEKTKRAKITNFIMQAPLAVWMIAFVLAPFSFFILTYSFILVSISFIVYS